MLNQKLLSNLSNLSICTQTIRKYNNANDNDLKIYFKLSLSWDSNCQISI